MAPKPVTSPVPVQWYPALSALLLIGGLFFTAFFFILAKEVVIAAVASTFLKTTMGNEPKAIMEMSSHEREMMKKKIMRWPAVTRKLVYLNRIRKRRRRRFVGVDRKRSEITPSSSIGSILSECKKTPLR
ncbi:Uncharacterized protein family (UPF0197) [Musa troglodytarum]|uniref:Dolichyl-diphosphooligosaccharide-protein glycosyltransferase subunit OST5 n=1 Tax=Musa troglodytarum TaxID=320322 RepID=A0A9E7FGG5_9LILI|nr:Uncharacterized protein family (UPF0197) [Musa troglodytarum]